MSCNQQLQDKPVFCSKNNKEIYYNHKSVDHNEDLESFLLLCQKKQKKPRKSYYENSNSMEKTV